ncbi:LuxR C-terminal-related transcriptional regulator [Polaromonas jejuensis]|uniref:LuxR C-terminal-related transcriptional regulator n=1 Tax=Polaromonas jejuensis TaxID=457502 RepID=A0ABW0Q8G7_9BURK
MGVTEKTRVLVAHRVPLVAAGLVATLRHQSVVPVEITNLDPREGSTLGWLRRHSTDVIIVDYDDGLNAATQIRSAPIIRGSGTPRVLILTGQDSECDIRHALERGVHGYVLLSCRLEEVIVAVEAVRRGARHLGPLAAQRLAESLTRAPLTIREMDVLMLLSAGDCNKAIGKKLNIAIGTVKSHVKSVLEKLDAISRTEAAAVARRRGLLPIEAQALMPSAPFAYGTSHRTSRNTPQPPEPHQPV